MIKSALDLRFISGFILAHLLMYFTFSDKTVFWYFFTATMLLLICFVVAKDKLDDKLSLFKYLFTGILSGALLYLLFWIGNQLIELPHIPGSKQITKLYKYYGPDMFWHYLALILVIVPGEEIFWRGFIQKRLLSFTSNGVSIVVSALLYASVHIYSGQFMLVFAAFIAGLCWSWLYAWRRSIPLVIVSHLIYDLFLFVLMPFR
ncbi:CPBP family intramembrane metalloprotease [Bacillus sp. DNRA2]|uniref:CPBP family intramembrane glutamic endopeptidase n=1 Tax=Bacillus sp. DNRA2 TaxID=2723053 RepID=UPI00145E776D|nr:type II CAAX endopeptidase family protein [Bacillus sp. DNRA2]NMD71890.1 CPBP family intramembrane metalloprotease [Bacillus sp. DNRA2]